MTQPQYDTKIGSNLKVTKASVVDPDQESMVCLDPDQESMVCLDPDQDSMVSLDPYPDPGGQK